MILSGAFLYSHILNLVIFVGISIWLVIKLLSFNHYNSIRIYYALLGILFFQLAFTLIFLFTKNETVAVRIFGLNYFLLSVFIFYVLETVIEFCGFKHILHTLLYKMFIVFYLIQTSLSAIFPKYLLIKSMSSLPVFENFIHFEVDFRTYYYLSLSFRVILIALAAAVLISHLMESGKRYRNFLIIMFGFGFFYLLYYIVVWQGIIPELFYTPFMRACSIVYVGLIVFLKEKTFSIASLSKVQILEKADFGMVVVDEFGFLVEINQVARDIFDFHEERVHIHISEIFLQWNAVEKQLQESKYTTSIVFKTVKKYAESIYELKAHFDEEKGIFCLITDITKNQQLMEKLTYLAYHDTLTGLKNRSRFENDFADMLVMAKNEKNTLSVMMFDMDGLKTINDTYGHDKGDSVLKVFSNYLQFVMPAYATLARLGGDEFVAAIYGYTAQQTEKVAYQLLENLHKDSASSKTGIEISCSIGISSFEQNETIPIGRILMRQADDALYKAKNMLGTKVVIWNPKSEK